MSFFEWGRPQPKSSSDYAHNRTCPKCTRLLEVGEECSLCREMDKIGAKKPEGGGL